eukprot:scaffold2742_cov130-Isochrysis_galbana.AAC.3
MKKRKRTIARRVNHSIGSTACLYMGPSYELQPASVRMSKSATDDLAAEQIPLKRSGHTHRARHGRSLVRCRGGQDERRQELWWHISAPHRGLVHDALRRCRRLFWCGWLAQIADDLVVASKADPLGRFERRRWHRGQLGSQDGDAAAASLSLPVQLGPVQQALGPRRWTRHTQRAPLIAGAHPARLVQ